MSEESKRERFARLIEKRLPKAVDSLRLLGNLANPSAYEYNPETIKKVISYLRDAVDQLEDKFLATVKDDSAK